MAKETKNRKENNFNEYDSIDRELSKTYFKKSGSSGAYGHSRNPFTYNKKTLRLVLASIIFIIFLLAMLIYKNSTKLSVKKDITVKSYAVKAAPQNFRIFYDFENDMDGWQIPLWAKDKSDHVAESLAKSNDFASNGAGSLKLVSAFPGGKWTASLVEISHYLDLTKYDLMTCDIYIPKGSPDGLRAQMILTVGENWKWCEMSRTFRLSPGEWVRITADLSESSGDFRRTIMTPELKSDVRKIAIRVESNQKPAYSGPIYIDNIRFWYN